MSLYEQLSPVAQASLEEWMTGKAEHVKRALHRYTPGTRLEGPGGAVGWLVGVGETEAGGTTAIVSPIDPRVDYDGSIAASEHAHWTCLGLEEP